MKRAHWWKTNACKTTHKTQQDKRSTHLRYCTIQHKNDVNDLMLCYYIKDITFHKCFFKQQRLHKEIPNI